MIKHVSSKEGKTTEEIVFANSVRSTIIRYLINGKEKRFGEIAKYLKKNDNVISRELNELVDRGWIIHTGERFSSRYKLDLKNPDVIKYRNRLNIAVPPDWDIHEIEISPFEMYRPWPSIFKDSRTYVNEQIPKRLKGKISIHLIADKIKEYEYPDDECVLTPKDFSLMADEFIKLVDIINRILILRSEAYLEHILKKDPELLNLVNELNKDPALNKFKGTEKIEKIKQKPYDKPLKVVISYTP